MNRHQADAPSAHEERGLKHRAAAATRTVPTPPELAALLREHIETFGTASDGRLSRRSGLRHADAGVPPQEVADRTGHSVEVLLRVSAKYLDGGEAVANKRIEAALNDAWRQLVQALTDTAHPTDIPRHPCNER